MENSRIWRKPQLVVLARSTPEEAVLTICKSTTAGSGNSFNHSNCQKGPGNGNCNICAGAS
jgi:hypothetical protein